MGIGKRKTENEEGSLFLRNVVAVSPPETESVGAQVFGNAWRSIPVIANGDGHGSGVIVPPNVVATNCHVVEDAGEILVYKSGSRRADTGTSFYARIRHAEEDAGFCLLDVEGLRGVPASVRGYDSLSVGEDVYAPGAPWGLDLSLSTGTLSQLREGEFSRIIQTDAAISPGSSGGGLFDRNGNLIGSMTSKIVAEEVEGINFAIPADLALKH